MKTPAPVSSTREAAKPRPPSLPARVLGWTLLWSSLGLVSCQSLFFL